MLKHKVKAILFDLDGVLVDSEDAWFCVINDTRRHFGLKPISKIKFKKRFGAPIEYDAKALYNGRAVYEIERFYNSDFRKRAKHVKLFPQSKIVLKN